MLVGPTALLSPALATRTRWRKLRPRDLGATLAWPGSWRMFRRFWRTGLTEMRHASSRRAFVRAAADYVPDLRPGDVEFAFAGVRAQALARDGALVDDFVVHETGARSTCATRPRPRPPRRWRSPG